MRASAAASHALADNPANLVRGGLYHLEAFAQHDPGTKLTGVGAAVVDSMTSKLAAGFAMRGMLGSNSAGKHSGWEGKLGLAFPLVESFSVGISARYGNFHIANPDAIPEDGVADQRFGLKHFTMDAGATISVGGLMLSGLAYNFINTGSALAPVKVGGSAAFSATDVLTLGGDVILDLKTFNKTKLEVGGGLEFLLGGSFPIRGGYRFDQGRERHAVTGGAGYVDTTIGAQMAVRQYLGSRKETNLMFVLQYFIR